MSSSAAQLVVVVDKACIAVRARLRKRDRHNLTVVVTHLSPNHHARENSICKCVRPARDGAHPRTLQPPLENTRQISPGRTRLALTPKVSTQQDAPAAGRPRKNTHTRPFLESRMPTGQERQRKQRQLLRGGTRGSFVRPTTVFFL